MQVRITHERVGPGFPVSQYHLELIKLEQDGTKSVLASSFREGGSAINLGVIKADSDNRVISQSDYFYNDNQWEDYCRPLCKKLYNLVDSVRQIENVGPMNTVEVKIESPDILAKLTALYPQAEKLAGYDKYNLRASNF